MGIWQRVCEKEVINSLKKKKEKKIVVTDNESNNMRINCDVQVMSRASEEEK